MGGNHSRPTPAKLPDVDGTKFRKYKFPFENLVLEGGGAKGMAYIGALKVLDDAGILQNIKRVGGTSAGSIVAGFLAVGMSPQELLDKLNEDIQDIVLHIPWYLRGPLKYLWYFNNLKDHFGMFPADNFLDWYGKAIEEHLEKIKKERQTDDFDNLNGDITFTQVYNAFGRELCTVSYETEFQNEVYSHVKTSPLLQIKRAVRMSMSIPVVFEAYQGSFGEMQPRHIDGGVSANYPIYCFEGWWLSMDPADTFHKRLAGLNEQNLKKNFLPDGSREHFQPEGDASEKEKIRKKTLGLCLYSKTHKGDKFQHQFEHRLNDFLQKNPEYKEELRRPSTKLANKYHQQVERLKADQEKFADELGKDLKLESKIKQVADAYPHKEEMKSRFDTKFTSEDIIQLYGKDDKEAAFKWLYLDYKNEPTKTLALDIYYNQKPLQEAKNKCLKGNFANTSVELYAQLLQFLRKNKPMEEADVGRSIGIDVDYITTLDFGAETEDKQYLLEQGAVAAVAFLEEWVAKHHVEEGTGQ